jgi:dephospho-CoA kinase
MVIIGLVGKLCSGKHEIAKVLKEEFNFEEFNLEEKYTIEYLIKTQLLQ